MVKNDNTRVIITLSKKQAKWLKDGAKKLHISVSKFVKWLIDKNIARIINDYLSEEDYKTLVKVAKMPWVDRKPEDNYEWSETFKDWIKK